MLAHYSNKLLRPTPDAPRSVCPFCRESGRLTVVHVHGKARQHIAGCKCDRKSILPRKG